MTIHSRFIDRQPVLDSPTVTLYKHTRAGPFGGRNSADAQKAQVAQSVEHCTENAGVGGSIPPLGTIAFLAH
jgi:hypothetical protein